MLCVMHPASQLASQPASQPAMALDPTATSKSGYAQHPQNSTELHMCFNTLYRF